MALKKASELGGGAFFKPAEHANDLALLIEPKSINKNVSSTYQGVTRERDEVTCDITVFANSEAVENGEPTEVLAGVKVVHGMMASSCERAMGEAFIGRVDKAQTQRGTGYVFRDVDAQTEEKVAAYYETRNAEPSFD